VDDEGKATIVRDRRVQSFPDDLEIEDGCTLGLQQGERVAPEIFSHPSLTHHRLTLLGMIEEAFLRDMDRNGLSVTRPFSFHSYQIDSSSSSPYPVTVQLTQGAVPEAVGQAGPLSTVRCKYLVGCDGGRSAVRRYAMKHDGVTFDGELLGALWGAGDFGRSCACRCFLLGTERDLDRTVVKTDFPDIRKIAAIHSAR
jgi:2-polyprenyl-6-methoxyphenol hydroxylase-like FAD-dependent oxidoreductase